MWYHCSAGLDACWLKAPQLQRPFIFDVLEFVLGNSAHVFRTIPAFEHALLVRVWGLLHIQTGILLDPAADPVQQTTELKPILRVVWTVMRFFHKQLKSKCGTLLETVLAGQCLASLPVESSPTAFSF
jgi:hypothetical protein